MFTPSLRRAPSRERRARAAIVVGIWNTPQRSQEYMPQRALEMLAVQLRRRRNPLSERYLKFLVEEVKPFIDDHYPTLADRENTFVMGFEHGRADFALRRL